MARRKPGRRPARGGRELDFDEVAKGRIVVARLGDTTENVSAAGDMHSTLNGNRGFGHNYCAAFGDFFEVAGDGFGGSGPVDADQGH